ncbi:UDP-N-acetyl-D-galactosamine:polypeptide N-acetylgalactosaminyltransferase T4, putative [Perkinsus marinus ATCC 50983]|uniref:UDP-N-acetyl-D-galactosamine:polypeptide N-acetylgalactosaminyltransferase T4, putative n=1 Tax=Perkinsus marinus (strain ATCC 50983 / TXsc) TaxID=423536 RepID=C5LB75_PERM5|nr:UDP-N-acetyl-D-galactosamine:polypeptide N-acetylgalactosaminyltransferase T4, putative [Perkinsus marinus ATCC 50983]EER06003.1 UDP-N-acetyl-D-galactosamine:polypeptide N-acetylgalactosaminyltransferase T4, putative [Perkinsus marinus ATCC 50983]|eukprot:XP_002774187.1 UDP-N-acetyl-D-galactosamine:polypeptide N-acetylgalactosaminyltransferase T4, putative [Perkinsus marinus ATCC 50983]
MASPKSSSRASHKPHNPRARRAAYYRGWATSGVIANPLAGVSAGDINPKALRGPDAQVPTAADEEYGILIETTLDENGQHPPVDPSQYPTTIKTISVVLAAHNEQKYIERTCESIYAETPADILKEIIVVDDASEPPLRRYLKNFPEVKVIRHTTRQGLIRSKTDGANAATGDMVVFLDAHVKPDPNWAQPLIKHANVNYKRVVVPVIPVLNGDDWLVHDNSAGSKMMFDWGLGFNWFEDDNDLVPIMSGGLLGITKRWWYESGEYDNGMLMWGGENIEQSIRVWLCGGEIYVARDSRVAHVFRPSFPYKIDNTQVYYNKIRTVEVWFDDYKDYFYSADPYAKSLRQKALANGIEDRLQFKKDMQCKPFQYFVDKFHKVFEMKGMLPSEAYLIKDEKSGLCVSSGGRDGDKMVLRTCDDKDQKQRWNDNPGSAIRNQETEMCIDANAGEPEKQGMALITYYCMMKNKNQDFKVADGMIQWQGWCAVAEPVVGATLTLTTCSSGFLRSRENNFVIVDKKKMEARKGDRS